MKMQVNFMIVKCATFAEMLYSAFYRQSLQLQHVHAELFHNATALRGINGPEDVQRMPKAQRDLAIRSIQIARQGLDITVNSPSYSEGMKYGELFCVSPPSNSLTPQ
jgi:hypothetical protein